MSEHLPELSSESDNRGGWLAALLIAATFFIASAPTLTWVDFSSGMENLNVCSVLEIHQNGQWLVPTLQGEPRTAKPPLPTWISAFPIRAQTFRDLDSPDPAIRASAYRSLAWQIRWPALLSSCLMLLAIFHFGRTVGGVWSGLLAMTIAGSTLFFLRFGKQATTDVQLALWTAVAMAALARICLVQTTWSASIVAGVALGFALMSKGPVGLLQTLAPAAVFLILARRKVRIAPVLVCLIVMLIAGFAWYAWVAIKVPTVWERWRLELTRASPVEKTGKPLSYLSIFAYMMPWSFVLVHGMIWTGVEAIQQRRRDGWVLALLMVIVPIVVMSFFPDRKERYILPLLTPASIVAARGLGAMLDANDKRRIPPWVQWATIMVFAVGFPLAGAFALKRADGTPWFTPQLALMTIAMLVVLIGVAAAMSRRWPLALVGATAGVMLLLQPVFFSGYRYSREGLAEMRPLAEIVRGEYPNAEPYYLRPQGHRRVPADFSIYMNRIAPWVADPADIKPSTSPQIYIILQRDNDTPPPAPQGWSFLHKVKRDDDWYFAFVRPPGENDSGSTQPAQ